MTAKKKAALWGLTAAIITALAEAAEKLAPEFDGAAGTAVQIAGWAFAAFRLYLMNSGGGLPPPQDPPVS